MQKIIELAFTKLLCPIIDFSKLILPQQQQKIHFILLFLFFKIKTFIIIKIISHIKHKLKIK